MGVYEFTEICTTTRTFKVEAESRWAAEKQAETLDGAFDISEIKEHGPSFTLTKLPIISEQRKPHDR
jgi:hypothetical protein